MVNNENNDSGSASPPPNPPTPVNPPNPPPNPVPPANPPAHLFKSLTAAEVAYRQLADQNRSQLAQFGLLDSKIDLLISSINVLAEAITARITPPDENPLEIETNLRHEFMERDRSAPLQMVKKLLVSKSSPFCLLPLRPILTLLLVSNS